MTDNNTQAQQPSPKPNPGLKRLDRLVGAWKVSDPAGPGGVNGQVSYEWMEGGFFLIQHVDLEHSGQKIRGIEIIGYLQPFGGAPSEDLKSRYYDYYLGDTLDYVYELEGDTLTIWGGEKGSPAFYEGTFSGNGNALSGAWVYPGGGGYESIATRTKDRYSKTKQKVK